MTTITKGTKVWMFRGWDDCATVVAHPLTIQSFGKKQGTATRTENGKNFLERLYADQDYAKLIPIDDMPDPTEHGLKLAAEFKQKNLAHLAKCKAQTDASQGYLQHTERLYQKCLAAEPTFIIK